MNAQSPKDRKPTLTITKAIQKPSKKPYTITSKDNKKLVLCDLFQYAACHLNITPTSSHLSADEFLRCIDRLGHVEYAKALIHILPRHFPNLTTAVWDQKTKQEWCKRVKSWVKSSDKPETRGGPSVPENYREYFLSEIERILDSLLYRCFVTLRPLVLACLESIHHHRHNGSKPFMPDKCSKHWWFDFIHEEGNEAILNKWEALPLQRTYEARQRKSEEAAQKKATEFVATEEEKTITVENMPVNQPYSQENQEVLEAEVFDYPDYPQDKPENAIIMTFQPNMSPIDELYGFPQVSEFNFDDAFNDKFLPSDDFTSFDNFLMSPHENKDIFSQANGFGSGDFLQQDAQDDDWWLKDD